MAETKKRTAAVVPFALGLGLIVLVALGAMVFFASASVSGTATLPNGTIATINGPFSCSNNTAATVIDAGGHVFEFTPTTVLVDKTPVASLDSSVQKVEIDASYWTASLRINGEQVPSVR
ncbi:hypothetical protein [Aeoliella sp.]|uniref:hypothetical protein n=1 Tax=Aeoliella sp. TaxID=2795800 RepID=UPI003CCBA7CE